MSRSQRIAEIFVELSDTLEVGFVLADYLHLLTERCVEIFAVDASGLMLADRRGGLQLLAATVERARSLEQFELQIDEGPCLDCYATGEAITNVDLRQAHTQWPTFAPAALAAGFRSTHALPMRLRSQVIGALNLFGYDAAGLTSEDVAIAQSVADVATIGILQERTVQEHAVLADQLQTALTTRVLVEQAKGVLSVRARISVGEAFHRIRSHARRNGLSISVVATDVVNGDLDEHGLPGS